MNILFVLIPLALVLLVFAIWAFFWAVRSGQFDDMDTPSVRILLDEDKDASRPVEQGSSTTDERV